MSIRPKKSLGQNFLRDPNMIRKILGSVRAPADAGVVEIGPGTGALTGELATHYPSFRALEVDERAIDYLATHVPHADVQQADVLEVNWATLAADLGGPLWVIGNLPYYITSPILFGLIDARQHIHEATLMMQREVAQRIVATPRTKAYGILSVVAQLYTRPDLLFTISPHVFYPQPDVTSALVRFTFTGAPATQDLDVDHALLRRVIRSAFNQRRKTLRNSLSMWARDDAIGLPDGYDRRRAEELTPQEFVELTQYIEAQMA